MTSATPPTIDIRPATPADADAIHAAILKMGEAIGGSLKITSTPEGLRRHGLAPNSAFEGLVAELAGTFAGMCLYFPTFSTWLGELGVYVQDLYVDQRFRRLGVGEKLIRRAAAEAQKRGATHLRLAVDADNLAAQRFYEGLGIGRYETDQIHAAYGDAFRALCERDKR